MKKFLVATIAVAGMAAPLFIQGAEAASNQFAFAPSAAQIEKLEEQQSMMLEAHLAGMKAGLNLSDEQARYWPAFEAAIRDAAKARAERWAQARERMSAGERPSPIERMSLMADHLDKNAAELRSVVAAGKPLYDSLTDPQKHEFGPLMRDFKPKKRL